jgi:hypothetical protein
MLWFRRVMLLLRCIRPFHSWCRLCLRLLPGWLPGSLVLGSALLRPWFIGEISSGYPMSEGAVCGGSVFRIGALVVNATGKGSAAVSVDVSCLPRVLAVRPQVRELGFSSNSSPELCFGGS